MVVGDAVVVVVVGDAVVVVVVGDAVVVVVVGDAVVVVVVGDAVVVVVVGGQHLTDTSTNHSAFSPPERYGSVILQPVSDHPS